MKKGLRSICILLAAVMVLTVAFWAPSGSRKVGAQGVQAQSVYELANRYYRIKAVKNGKYLLGNRAGYEAQAANVSSAMVFYMKPAGLGEYIFYDSDSKYLTVNAFNAIVRTNGLGDNVIWCIEAQGDGRFAFKNLVKGKYVSISGTSLKWRGSVDTSCLFTFEEAAGNNPFPEADVCMDITDIYGNKVDIKDAMAKPAVGERIIGFADTHAHLNHNLGSGKAVFNGMSFSPLGIQDALKACTDKHGVNGCFDLWGKLVDGTERHNTDGYPNFTFWPDSHSTNHIQTYYKWLERAYLSGQRLMVHQCVNNATLGAITNALPPYLGSELRDMEIAREQIQNIYDMQEYIDAQYGGRGEGWFRIVTSGAEARRVISEGKMAVFLSLEMDTVFECDTDYIGQYEAGKISKSELDARLARIEAQINEFYELGIRSVFPVHALNNGFAGCQLYQGEIFSIMNFMNRGDFYQPEPATNRRVLYKQPKATFDSGDQGHQNSIGLTKTGEWLIRKLIEKKYVIEVDHMSDKAFNSVLDILWEEKYPGIIASHTRLLDLFDAASPDAVNRNWEQMDIPRMIKVLQLGGVISPMLWETMEGHQKAVAAYLGKMIELSEGQVPTVAQLDIPDYQHYSDGQPYEVPTTWYNMNGNEADDLILGIPYGSDVNGACMLPHFDNREAEYGELDYGSGSFDALYEGIYSPEVANVSLYRQTTGNRTFDINTQGVAHYGLIPDFIKRLQTSYLKPGDIIDSEALFNSAESYVRMIERMERYSDTYPSRDEAYWPVTGNEYWH